MKNKFNSIQILAMSTLAIAVFAVAFGAFPQNAQAQGYGYPYDPACPSPTVYSNGYYTCNQQVSYGPTYPSYPTYSSQPPQYQQLSATCYPNSSSVPSGSSVQWVASPMGGSGQFSYNWSGTDGLGGTSQTATMTYYNPGTKTGQVTVYSGGQSVTASCSNYVTVYNQSTYYPPTYPTYPNYGYNYQYQYYSPLRVSCVSNATYVGLGNTVTWSASATGGNGYYQYSWTGTDGIYGQGQSIAYTYNQPGTKYASVTVYSNGQTVTEPCANIVNVGLSGASVIPGGAYPIYSNPNALDVACFADPTSAAINQAVTWKAEATRGTGQYTYNWSGSDNLSGNQASVIKFYSTPGLKNAVVSVTSADGKTGTHACSVTVRGASEAVKQPPQQPAAPAQPTVNQNVTAASYFSLGSIPWGWVAVLVILILFATVMYLLFNKPKI